MLTGRYWLACLSLCMTGCSFFMIPAIVWWFLKVSSTVAPRSFEFVFWIRIVLLMLSCMRVDGG